MAKKLSISSFLFTLFLFLFLLPSSTEAVLDLRCRDQNYVEKTSTRIILGQVQKIECDEKRENKLVTVLVEKDIKGTGNMAIKIQQFGCSYDGVEVEIEDQPALKMDQRGKFYLMPTDKTDIYWLVCGRVDSFDSQLSIYPSQNPRPTTIVTPTSSGTATFGFSRLRSIFGEFIRKIQIRINSYFTSRN